MLTEKQKERIEQLQTACQELSNGFKNMGEQDSVSDDDWVTIIEAFDEVRAAMVMTMAKFTAKELAEVV
ncbi:MAG TPA: hypothetical protein VF077_09550 [Nitrospiraceae bacterium]